MDLTGKCYCPVCHQKLTGQLVIREHVWLARRCPEHGPVMSMIYDSFQYFAEALERSESRVQPNRCLVVEVTERCDVGCSTCSASSTNVGTEHPKRLLVDRALAKSKELRADVVALSGGEPLMRDDIWEIADSIHSEVDKVVLITIGRSLESNPVILEEISARSEWLEIYLQFDSLRDSVLHTLRSPSITADLRRRRLALALGTGAQTSAVCVIPPDIPESDIGELATFLRSEGASGVTFQPLRRLGRHPGKSGAPSRIGTVDFIQKTALRALGVACPEPQAFVQQPFDISVAAVKGSQVTHPEAFFWKKESEDIFRVATNSYWDFTNYFEPLAKRERFYFYVGAKTPLNGHYFSARGKIDSGRKWTVSGEFPIEAKN